MATAIEIVSRARGYIGTKENPSGSNNVLFNTDYYGHPVSGSEFAWCAVFLWDIFRMCGASQLYYDGQKTASCTVLMHWGKKSGLEVPVSEVRDGDIVLFDWNGDKTPDHVGLAAGSIVRGTFPTIEGNVGDMVQGLNRLPSQVCCVLRPKYEEGFLVLTKDEVQKMIDSSIEQALGAYIACYGEVPKSLQPEVRKLLDCGAINGGTPASVDPNDINLPYNILRAVVMSMRYTNEKVR